MEARATEQRAPATAVLGAGGTMGLGIAANLVAADIDVRAWNRTAGKLAPLAKSTSVQICETPAEAASGAGTILTVLSDAAAVMDAMQGPHGALAGAKSGAIWMQSSTISIEPTQACAELAGSSGLEFVDAPVLGTKKPAADGELVILASGPAWLEEHLRPLFEAIGKRTIWAGETGAGTRLKLAVNSWIFSVVEGAAESLALAEGLGLDPSKLLDAISGGAMDTPYLQLRGKAMIERDFEPSMRLALAAKDAGLIVEAAQRAGLDLPMLESVSRRMAEAARLHGEEDMAATYLASSPIGAEG